MMLLHVDIIISTESHKFLIALLEREVDTGSPL